MQTSTERADHAAHTIVLPCRSTSHPRGGVSGKLRDRGAPHEAGDARCQAILSVDCATMVAPVCVGRDIRNRVFRLLDHQMVYDAEYFAKTVEYGSPERANHRRIDCSRPNPRTVMDVGFAEPAPCSPHCKIVDGWSADLEYADAAIEQCRHRQLNVQRFDIARDAFRSDEQFDVAICLEVAEHLPEQHADRLVALLTSLSATIVFTAALGQVRMAPITATCNHLVLDCKIRSKELRC